MRRGHRSPNNHADPQPDAPPGETLSGGNRGLCALAGTLCPGRLGSGQTLCPGWTQYPVWELCPGGLCILVGGLL